MSTLTKRDKLLNSALTLFSSQGIHSTSTASIAKHASVANGTLFHHFENKLALVEALYISIKQTLSQSVVLTAKLQSMPIKAQANALWDITLDWSINNPTQLLFCQQVATENVLPLQTRLQAMKQELSILETLITAGQAQNAIVDFPIELMIDQCQSQIICSSLFFINNPVLVADTNYRTSAFELFWRSIAV